MSCVNDIRNPIKQTDIGVPKSQSVETRETFIHRIGQELAAKMPTFWGSIKFNLTGGRYVNANIEESVKPNGATSDGHDKRTK